MTHIYANLLGNWIDITKEGTVADHQDPSTYFEDNLQYQNDSKIADCFEYDYIRVQYQNKDYRIHPSMIQIVSE